MNYTLSTTTTTHYTDALAKGVGETETFPGLRGDGIGKIETVIVKSLEKLAWQIEVLDKNGNIVHKQTFTENDAIEKAISEVTYYFYSKSDLDWAIPLTIPNVTVEVTLRNMSETSKTAGTEGAVLVQLQICK